MARAASAARQVAAPVAPPAPRRPAVQLRGQLPTDLKTLAPIFGREHTMFFDISTLRETQFTGIPNVAANLAREIIDADFPSHFFIGENIVKRDYVRFLLDTNGGAFFGYHHQTGQATECTLLERVCATPLSVGLFPAEKPFHRLFDVELQVLHDFSTIVTPFFHLKATNDLHGASLLRDIATNDHTFCVSTATAEYLKALCPDSVKKVSVSLNGVRWPAHFEALADSLYGNLNFEPFVMILGTLEPRKNLEVVFRAMGQDKDLARRYRFIFTGKEGWLFDFGNSVKRHLGEIMDNFQYAGFVSEFKKYCLLRFSRFTIYPSLFEGFGLPILESFSVGTPTVYSASSSMPEVGGNAGYLFAPDSPEALLSAIYRLEADLAQDPQAVARTCLEQATHFTWENMLAVMLRETLDMRRKAAR